MVARRSLVVLLVALTSILASAFPSNAFPRLGLLDGVPATDAKPGVVLANSPASVPRSHGPVSREIVGLQTSEKPGTIIISNKDKYLYRVLSGGKAERYTISVGRDGFFWTGTVFVGAKKEWPGWRPPAAMRARSPSLPEYVPPGPYNPLGARALYLYENGRDTLYRIHGTNDSSSLGTHQTSGCFRLSNADVMTLYKLVSNGTKVIVE